MARSTGQVSEYCTVFGGDLKCWAMQEALVESELLLMMRDDPEPGAPLPAVELGSAAVVTSFATFRSARCAALAGEGIKCWGRNNGHGSDHEFFVLGQPDPTMVLGDDPQKRGSGLPFVPLGATDAIAVVSRAFGFCALFSQGVKCWGPANPTLGLGDDDPRGDDPAEMGDALPFVDLGRDFAPVGLAGGPYAHVCAWSEDGLVKCWGYNFRGQLGIVVEAGEAVGDGPGEMGDALRPVGLGADFHVVQVSVGAQHSCALSSDGEVKCWGANSTIDPAEHIYPESDPYDFGRLGTGDHEDRVAPFSDALLPIDLGSLGGGVVAIASADIHNCAVFADGRLKCWGTNKVGQLGLGDSEARGDDPDEMGDALPFVDLGDKRVVSLGCDHSNTCVLLEDDTVRCWGAVPCIDCPAGNEPGDMGEALRPLATAEDLGGASE